MTLAGTSPSAWLKPSKTAGCTTSSLRGNEATCWIGVDQVGYACTIYRGVRAEHWFERLEALSLHDFTADVVFSDMTGASKWCMGSSIAFRRSILKEIGGLEPLAQYLVEDFEMGRRIHAKGFKAVLVPYTVDTVVDLGSAREWWNHQLYWDLNTRMARLGGFLAQVVIRSVPFALLFAAVRLFDFVGLGVLAGALAFRLGATAITLRMLEDREGLRSLFWLPVRDVAGLGIWLLALVRRTVVWRGVTYRLTRDGRMVPVR